MKVKDFLTTEHNAEIVIFAKNSKDFYVRVAENKVRDCEVERYDLGVVDGKIRLYIAPIPFVKVEGSIDELKQKAYNILADNNELYCQVIEDLNENTDVEYQDFICNDMEWFNDTMSGYCATDILDMVDEDFDTMHDYYYNDCGTYKSTNDKVGLYRARTLTVEVLDNIILCWADLDGYYFDEEFTNIIESIKDLEQ